MLPLVPKETTAGGVIMPERTAERDRPMEGIVLAVGRGRPLDSGAIIPLECESGDVVQFGKFAGIVVFDEVVGYDVLLLREDEALGRKQKLSLVNHEGHDHPHVPGDPRCATCRAGGAGAVSTSTR